MKLFIVAALVALAAAEPPVSYGAPGQSYGAPGQQQQAYSAPAPAPGNSYGAPGGSGIPSQSYGAGLGRGAGGISDGPIESDPNLQLENEGANLPSDIVGQDLLDRVVDAVSQDLAQQEAARAAQAGLSAYGVPSAPVYGPPSSQYGAPNSQYGAPGGLAGSSGAGGPINTGRIMLLIPPDPLKAKLIANYIQKSTRPVAPGAFRSGAGGLGGYNGGNNGGYN